MPKRRADWLLGRVTAKSVVAAALREAVGGEWPPAAIEIGSEPSGAPYARLAPGAAPVAGFAPGERLPIAVSLSHAGGRALAAATASGPPPGGGPPLGLGVDLGLVEPRSPAFLGTFLTDEEQRFVAAAPPERDLRANLVWCAKEAVLKALGLGLTVDTILVSCLPAAEPAHPSESPLAPPDGEWRPFVAACGDILGAPGGRVRGVWRTFGPFVATLASVGGAAAVEAAADARRPTPVADAPAPARRRGRRTAP